MSTYTDYTKAKRERVTTVARKEEAFVQGTTKAESILSKMQTMEEGGIKGTSLISWEDLNTAFGEMPTAQIVDVMKGLKKKVGSPIQNKVTFTWNQLNSVLHGLGWTTLRIVDLIGKLLPYIK